MEFDKEVSLKLYIGLVLRKWLLKEKNTIEDTLLWSALEQLEMCPGTHPSEVPFGEDENSFVRRELQLRILPKGLPVGEQLSRMFLQGPPHRGYSCLRRQATFSASSRTWQHCLYGTDLTGKNDTRMGYQRGLCQGS